MPNTAMHLCRACGSHTDDSIRLSTAFETDSAAPTYMEAFVKCTTLSGDPINADPPMPQHICFACSEELRIAYAFLCKAIATNEKLRDFVGDAQSSNTYQIAGDMAEHRDLDKENFNRTPDELRAFVFPKGGLECALCGKGYFTADGLQQHACIHVAEQAPTHPTKRRHTACECQVCGKMLSSSYHWKMHMKLHTGQRDFLCDLCPKTFTSLHKLRYHVRSHTGDRPYRCPHCDKRFCTTTTLNAHCRTHIAAKEFPCNLCDRKFKQGSTLKTHIKINHMTGTFACVVCAKNFSRSADLHIHMRRHTGEKPYKCALCSREYVTQANLNWHMKKAHSTQRISDDAAAIAHKLE